MNKTAIQKFAVEAHKALVRGVEQRAYNYGVTAEGCGAPDAATANGRVLTDRERSQRRDLVEAVQAKGYAEVMEEAAYTWFNRFIALRYMEVNDYLPTHVRVFSNAAGAFEPEILREALHLDLPGLDRQRVAGYIERNESEALYRYLLLTQCNALGEALPQLFERISGYTELLCPDGLLRPDSVLARMVADIPESDWSDQVQIIGWMYQYYISEKHEQVVDPLHGKVVEREDIPAATQLFTTDWVVRYMVDNSLGRYWLERHPESGLAGKLEFLVTPKSGALPTVGNTVAPEELTLLDPCVGSGHVLVYAFDVLMEIYKECGYAERDAAQAIVRNNLFGLDIDKRAAQMACFAVMMKGRKYDRRFLQRGLTPQIYCPEGYDTRYPAGYADGMEYGSLILVDQLETRPQPGEATLETAAENAENTWNFRRLLAQKYTVVCTNPPYLNKYNAKLKKFVNDYYKDYSGDLFSVFIYRNLLFCQPGGYCGYMTPNVWMFIKSYEKLRSFIIQNKRIDSLIQMAKGAFFKEATVDICTFVLQNMKSDAPGLYIRLENFKGDMDVQRQKVLEALANKDCGYFYETSAQNFTKIPGAPVAYWVSGKFSAAYKHCTLSKYGNARSGLQTGNNDYFLKFWYEVSSYNIAFGMRSKSDYLVSQKKWVPQIKGGDYRKWYGNFDYVVNWSNDGAEIRVCKSSRLNAMANNDLFFIAGITWSHTTSSVFGARYLPEGFLFNVEAPTFFSDSISNDYVLGFLNSCVSQYYLNAINPTLHYLVGNIISLPVIIDSNINIDQKVKKSISLSQGDWDSYETSWDFKKHPLI